MFSFFSLSSTLPGLRQGIAPVSIPNGTFGARFRNQIAPRKVKYAKRQKGRIPIPTGGSTRGTTLAYGEYGIRIKGQGVRFTAKQLSTAEEVIKRAIKVVKGAKVYLRVFPDIPVCIKVRSCLVCEWDYADTAYMQGNETRMGKGKGTFEFWATRYGFRFLAYIGTFSMYSSVPTGRVIFEVGGVPIREEIAREGGCLG